MLCQECFFFDNHDERNGKDCSLFPRLVITADSNWTDVCQYQRGKINGKTYQETEEEFQKRGLIKKGKAIKVGNR